MLEKDTGIGAEETSSSDVFLDYLWDVMALEIGHELVSGPRAREAEQAEMARKYLPRWREITRRLLTAPKSLTFRDFGIEFSEEFVQVLPDNPKEPPSNLPLKYSYFHGIVDLGSPNSAIPQSKTAAKPQIEFRIKELFRDSRRQLHASIAGMEEAVSGLGATWLRESTLGGRDFIHSLLRAANSKAILDMSLVGKAIFYDPDLKELQPLNLLGVRIEITQDGSAFKVEQLIRFLSATFSRPFPGKLPTDAVAIKNIFDDFDKKLFKLEGLIRKKVTSR